MVTLTPLYASLLAFVFFALSVRTLRLRRAFRIGIGDAGNPQLLRAMRVHANFAEYVPLTLLLVLLMELRGVPPALIHGGGAILVLGRIAHAYGVSQIEEQFGFRVFGMAMTFLAMLGSASVLLLSYTGLPILAP